MTLARSVLVNAEQELTRNSLRSEQLLAALGQSPLRLFKSLAGHGALPVLDDARLSRLPLDAETVERLRLAVACGVPAVVETRQPATDMRRLLDAQGMAEVAIIAAGPVNAHARDRAGTLAWRGADLLRALRPHQWVKNILLLLPVVAAHRFDAAALLPVLLGMIAFSAAASSIYIVNDLLDLDADRRHAVKCRRPFASGAVPIRAGLVAAVLLASAAMALAQQLNAGFVLILGIYMTLSLAYSLRLKRMRWIDIATLAALYMLRVVAGALAADIMTTGYLLVFIYPVFLTLGAVKRLTELTLAPNHARLPGRGYARSDRGDLLNVAGLCTVGAMVVFFLYSFTEHALSLYPVQWIMWLSLLPIGGWLVRMVWLGYAGKQDHDPIVFAMRDRYGLSLLIVTLTMMFYAAGLII